VITSPQNPLIQHIRKLQDSGRARREAGQFVIEGVRLAEEALQAGLTPATLIHTPRLDERGEQVLQGYRNRGVASIPVDGRALRAASATHTPQGILAVLPLQPRPLPAAPTFLLILDGLRDPGNLGAILRTAAAAGVQGVLAAPGSADPYQPKALRAGMGAHFRLPVHAAGWDEIAGYAAPLQTLLADAAGGTPFTAADLAAPLALIIGGEARGADPQIENLAPRRIRIPMPGGTESLNAAVAAGILIYEVLRQRT
jgi:TrmH family RNA methyltransferase